MMKFHLWFLVDSVFTQAVFFANGVEFYRAPSRGLTLVTVRSDGTRKDSATFDTMYLGKV